MAYHADAVHWNGDAESELRIASLSCVDSHLFAYSHWAKTPTTTTEPEVWIVPAIFNESYFPNEARRIAVALSGADSILVESTVVAGLGWYHVLFSGDCSTVPATCKLYLNDVDVTNLIQTNSAPFVPTFNGQVLQHPRKDTGYVADNADFWLAVGQSLLDGGGDIPVATRRKFISATGKPVHLGENGEVPTGTAPTVFFSGDATAYKTNRGLGGAFAFTGTLINASTSPSGERASESQRRKSVYPGGWVPERLYAPPRRKIKQSTAKALKELYEEAREEIPEELQVGLISPDILVRSRATTTLPPAGMVDFEKLARSIDAIRVLVAALNQARERARQETATIARRRKEEGIIIQLLAELD